MENKIEALTAQIIELTNRISQLEETIRNYSSVMDELNIDWEEFENEKGD